MEISSFLCGYDSSTCSDSTFVTTNTPLTSTFVNSSYCATFSGSNSLTINSLNEITYVKYLFSSSVFGEGAHHFIVQKANATIENFICVNSSFVGTLFWIDSTDILYIINGTFIGPKPNNIVNDNRERQLKFDNCKSNFHINDVDEMPIIIEINNFWVTKFILAENCEISKINKCSLNQQSLNLNINFNHFVMIIILL